MQNKLGLKNLIMWILLFACVPLTILYPKIFGARRYYLASFIFALLSCSAVMLSFEKSQPGALKMSLIAVLSAMAIAGRAVFAGIPFFKPVGAVIILTGASLGPQAGFMCGAVSMLVSNFLFSQGPWTLWQMLAFGVMGLLSGFLFHNRKTLQKPSFLATFGFLEYILITGPILDLSGIFSYSMGGKRSLHATLLAGLSVNIIGGISTFIFLIILATPIMRKINRLIKKYGI